MAKLDSVLRSKFRGCMLGTLIGDCLGAPFEGDTITPGAKLIVQRYFDKLDGPYFKAPYKNYTDDTDMTMSVAKCLVDKPAVDYNLMARLFVKQYYNQPHRGYGRNVVDVFAKLRKTQFQDVFKPARDQFEGVGSYGNGGAMRIAPIAMYFHRDYDAMLAAARKTTELTHTNKLGVDGALLQCIAVQQSLLLDPTEPVDAHKFVRGLIEKMKSIEGEAAVDPDFEQDRYEHRLKLLQQFLAVQPSEEPLSDVMVSTALGNGVAAIESVPTAIYCFLRAQKPIPDLNCDDPFRRTIQYAVSLGGDTDTIAAMAGSLAGAYMGEEAISKSMLAHCEATDEVIEMADNLLTVISP